MLIDVSFVVPIYKIKEGYLRECIESMMLQSNENIEIILVDDGSPDNCGEICNEYALIDKRIRVLHQENQGVSVARNNGMRASKGELIAFVDADDYVDKDYAKRIMEAKEKEKADIYLFGYYSVNGQVIKKHSFLEDHVYEQRGIKRLQLGILNPSGESLFIIPASPWAKAFKREFLLLHDIKYVSGIKRM